MRFPTSQNTGTSLVLILQQFVNNLLAQLPDCSCRRFGAMLPKAF